MKKYPTIKSTLLVSLLMLLHSTTVFSQGSLTGIISDETSGEKIRGAVVSIEHTFLKAITDANGNFTIANVKNGPMKLHVTHLAYQDYSEEIKSAGSPLAIRLKEKTVMADEVNVVATRAGGKSAIAYTNLEKEEIEKQNLGQDLPYLLNMTPSVVVTSDAGTGVGYTGIRIRGSDATRVNVTINGIPVNDAEGHLVYWVDLPDFASSVDNIQIQRGIGTSTNGAGAFGGSVNIQSTKLSAEPFASVNSSFGSFNTMKNTVQFGTGLLNKTFAMEGRFSKITSDGYIDRATSDLKSFYLSGGYYGNKSSLRMILFSGKEKTYQAWYGVPQEKLNGNTDSLMNHYYNNLGYVYFTPQDSLNLFNSNNRTYNLYTYPNQTDNYQQDYYQLLYSRSVNANWNLNAALHYTKGKGYYEEYEHAQSLAAYHLDTMFINNDTVVTTNLVRQRWLDNDFYGFTFSTNYTKTKMRFSLGGAGNRYHGKHYDEVTWMEKNPGTPFPYRYADNDATKNDFTVFAKLNYEITSRLEAYGDLQYRTITYEFPGFDLSLNHVPQKVHLDFFNPKAGISFDIHSNQKLYASIGIGHKEPVRDDYVSSSPLSRPAPEEMQDAEAGYRYTTNRFMFNANYYFMNYKDQLILTGKINDVGAYIRQNVKASYRTGMEMEAAYFFSKQFIVKGNVALSQNKIRDYEEYLDDYDSSAQALIIHKNVDIAFSPNVVAAGIISFSPAKNLFFDFVTKYVGRQYLDNTSNDARKLKPYVLNDIRLDYRIHTTHLKEFAITCSLNNIFNRMYESNGYTYSYVSGGKMITQNYYYPQAGINFFAGVSLKF